MELIHRSDAAGKIDVLQVFHLHFDGMLDSYRQKFFSRKALICNVSAYQTQTDVTLSPVARVANVF